MKNTLLRKGLVVGIIALFIGLAFIPNFNAISVQKFVNKINNKLIAIPIKIYNSNRIENYNIYRTQQQAEDFDDLIGEFKEDLTKSESIEETVEIYRDMVISLDNLGLLPNRMSIKQAEDLVIGNFYNSEKHDLFSEKIIIDNSQNLGNETFENSFCYVSGSSSNTDMMFSFFWSIIYFLTGFFWGDINHGCMSLHTYVFESAEGWIHSKSLQKKWTYEGKFYGLIEDYFDEMTWTVYFVGIDGFKGYVYPNFYFGRANKVKIRSLD